MSSYYVGVNKTKPKRWKKKFQGYFDQKKKETPTFLEHYEYVIEKLAVKCLPPSVIALSDEELSEPLESHIFTDTGTSSSSFEQPPKNFTKSFKKFSSIPKKFSIKPSKSIHAKKLYSIPTVSSSKPSKKIQRKTEFINWFTAFHPHLKNSDRPPKEPTDLKFTINKRSFAEELSEIAAKNDKPSNTNSELENGTIVASKASSTSGEPPI